MYFLFRYGSCILSSQSLCVNWISEVYMLSTSVHLFYAQAQIRLYHQNNHKDAVLGFFYSKRFSCTSSITTLFWLRLNRIETTAYFCFSIESRRFGFRSDRATDLFVDGAGVSTELPSCCWSAVKVRTYVVAICILLLWVRVSTFIACSYIPKLLLMPILHHNAG